MDNYKEVKVMQFPNMIARIHIPDLTEEERSKRMKAIHKHAAELMKKVKT
jgi:ribosome recycling factor